MSHIRTRSHFAERVEQSADLINEVLVFSGERARVFTGSAHRTYLAYMLTTPLGNPSYVANMMARQFPKARIQVNVSSIYLMK